jgi:predicted nucleic acid-binding protein
LNNRESKKVLVDTCIWIDFLRRKGEKSGILEELLKTNRVVTAGIILFELSQGMKNEKDRANITHLLADLDYEEMSQKRWTAAGTIAKMLKAKGFILPQSDILLASIALDLDIEIFSLDGHFDVIPGLKRYQP